MEIDSQITKCPALESAIEILKSQGWEVILDEIADVHFHQFKVVVNKVGKDCLPDMSPVEGIQFDARTWACMCHWSTIEVG